MIPFDAGGRRTEPPSTERSGGCGRRSRHAGADSVLLPLTSSRRGRTLLSTMAPHMTGGADRSVTTKHPVTRYALEMAESKTIDATSVAAKLRRADEHALTLAGEIAAKPRCRPSSRGMSSPLARWSKRASPPMVLVFARGIPDLRPIPPDAVFGILSIGRLPFPGITGIE